MLSNAERQVVLEMLFDRGYASIEEDKTVVLQDEQQFQPPSSIESTGAADSSSAAVDSNTSTRARTQGRVTRRPRNQQSQFCYTFVAWKNFKQHGGAPDVGVVELVNSDAVTLALKFDSNRPTSLITIRNVLTPDAKLDSLVAKWKTFGVLRTEHFAQDFFVVNRTHNSLVPQHVLLSPADANKAKAELSAQNIPGIRRNDAIAMYFGADAGDIFKIVRPHEGVSYRIVIE